MKRAGPSSESISPAAKVGKIGIGKERLVSGRMYLNKIHLLPDEFNEKAISLKEILAEIRPTASIHFNFMIDFAWLIQQYPDLCKSAPMRLVVGEKMGTSKAELKRAIGSRTNVAVSSARLPIPFGTHHTKLSLFDDEECFHVVISTANLIQSDWEAKTQCVYYTKGKLIPSECDTGDDYLKADLIEYLSYYKLEEVNFWIDRLSSFTFPKNGDRLVYSVPGYHKSEIMNKVGHLSLRKKLAVRSAAEETHKSCLFVLQCSSIGSLGASLQAWIEPQFTKSLRGGKDSRGRTLVIYPTVENVRDSIQGYASGGSLPYQKSTAQKQAWMQSVFCKWRSEKLGRSRVMPHCKTYTELLDGVPQWVIMTSANLSKAAWGELQKNCTQLMVRSYEMGVLIVDPERFLLPYDYPLVKFSPNDKPWICDINYTEADCMGETWIVS